MQVSAFLTAEWRMLAMLNWRVDPALLRAYVPRGTELDFHDGAAFVSVIGYVQRHTPAGLADAFPSDV